MQVYASIRGSDLLQNGDNVLACASGGEMLWWQHELALLGPNIVWTLNHFLGQSRYWLDSNGALSLCNPYTAETAKGEK